MTRLNYYDTFFLQLRTIILFLLTRWKLIAVSVGVGLSFSIGAYVSTEQLVTVTAHIQIGRVGSVGMQIPDQEKVHGNVRYIDDTNYYGLEPGFRLLLSVEELYRQITAEYLHRRARRGLLDPPYISELNNFEGHLLEVVVKGSTKDEALQYSEEILEKVVSQHLVLFEQTKNPLVDLRSKVAKIIDEWSETKESSSSEKDMLFRLLETLYALDRALTPPNTTPTKVASGPIIVDSNDGESLILYIVSGIFFGFLVGILVAIFLDAFRFVRNR